MKKISLLTSKQTSGHRDGICSNGNTESSVSSMPACRQGVSFHGDEYERQWLSTTRARNTAWMRLRRAKQVPSAGTLWGEGGIQVSWDIMRVSCSHIRKKKKKERNNADRTFPGGERGPDSLWWNGRCVAMKSWVVLWGQGSRSPCSMSGDLGQLRAEENRAAVESAHNASFPSFQCSFCKLIVILFF